MRTIVHDPRELLTPRQLKIARLLYEGHAPKTIARRLGITTNTVAAHISWPARG